MYKMQNVRILRLLLGLQRETVKCFGGKGSGEQRFKNKKELDKLKYTGKESQGNKKSNDSRVGRTKA